YDTQHDTESYRHKPPHSHSSASPPQPSWQQPRYTLFPYTTLFRSRRPVRGAEPRIPRPRLRQGVCREPRRRLRAAAARDDRRARSEEHTSELQSLRHLVCRLLLEKKKTMPTITNLPSRCPLGSFCP